MTSSAPPSEPYICPRCTVMLGLAPEHIAKHASICPKCRGTFLHDLKAYREAESLVRPVLFEWRHIPDADAQQQMLSCPRCGKASTMHKGKSERDRKVVVDVCPKCSGCWLDAGELDAIQVDALPTFLATVARWLEEA